MLAALSGVLLKFFAAGTARSTSYVLNQDCAWTLMVSQGKYCRAEDIWVFKEAYFVLGTFKGICVVFDGLPKTTVSQDLTSWDVKSLLHPDTSTDYVL